MITKVDVSMLFALVFVLLATIGFLGWQLARLQRYLREQRRDSTPGKGDQHQGDPSCTRPMTRPQIPQQE